MRPLRAPGAQIGSVLPSGPRAARPERPWADGGVSAAGFGSRLSLASRGFGLQVSNPASGVRVSVYENLVARAPEGVGTQVRRAHRERTNLQRLKSFRGLVRSREALVQRNALQNGAYGCAIGSMASELADQDDQARAKLAETFVNGKGCSPPARCGCGTAGCSTGCRSGHAGNGSDGGLARRIPPR